MQRRPRVLLVTPPYHAGVVEAAGVWMPLNLVYVAGHARRVGAEVHIYDAMSLGHTHEDIVRVIEDYRPTVVGTTAITATEPDAREICATAKAVDPEILTVLGNVHPTFCWEEILRDDSNVDVVVRGEGEATFAELIQAHHGGVGLSGVHGIAFRQNGVPTTTQGRPLSDLDTRIAAWDLLDWTSYYYLPHPEGQLGIVNSSRGCSQACSFCSQQKFWARSWRGRDPEAFVAELEMLRDRYGMRVAMLSDETPTVNRQRWLRILDLLIERQVGVELLMETRVDDIIRDEVELGRYVDAGVSHIYVGVEAVDQGTLDLYNKNTRVAESKRAIELINGHGMVSETSFVLGTLGESREGIRRTLEAAKWYAPDMAFFLALTPWPYADLFPGLEEHVATRDYRRYNLVEPVLKPLGMTLDEVKTELHRATGHFFRDKFMNLDRLPPKKRRFMVSVLRILIERSYLGDEMRAMAGAAEMPAPVRKMVDELGIDLGPPRPTSGSVAPRAVLTPL